MKELSVSVGVGVRRQRVSTYMVKSVEEEERRHKPIKVFGGSVSQRTW
jgi:hypothetical protein